MDLQYFVQIIWKRRWLLGLIMLMAAVTTFFLVGLRPYKFKSKATIETNVLNSLDLNVLNNNPFVQQYEVESKFSQFINLMKSRPIIKLLSDELLYHDLTADGIEALPFREPEFDTDVSYSQNQINEFVSLLASVKDTLNSQILSQYKGVKYNKLAEAFEYDYVSIIENLEVKRIGESDFISVEFTSEHPDLSYFAANKFCEEFLYYFATEIVDSENSTINKFKNELNDKEAKFRTITAQLDGYRQKHNIVDIEKQSGSVIEQLTEIQARLETTKQNIARHKKSLTATTREIEKISPEMNNGFAKKQFLNDELEKIQNTIKRLNNQYISSGQKDIKLAEKLHKLREQRQDISKQIAIYSNKNDRLENQRLDDLLSQKLQAEIDLNAAQTALVAQTKEKERLTGNQNKILTDDAGFKQLNSEWNLAYEEYKAAKAKFDKADVSANIQESPLKIFEYAQVPEKAEPKNRAIFGAFAGIVSGILTTILLFFLAFFDTSYSNKKLYQHLSGLHNIGAVNKLKNQRLDFEHIFQQNQIENSDNKIFTEAIRKIRFVIQQSGHSSILITSNQAQEGKSFLTLTLAYALGLNHKSVLIIDANFKNNSLSSLSNLPNEENPFIENNNSSINNPAPSTIFASDLVDIMGNNGDHRSASEVLAGKNFKGMLAHFKVSYDFILIEAANLNHHSDARELSLHTDAVILVNSAENALNSADKESFQFIKSLNHKFLGTILNNVNPSNIS